MKKEVKRQSLLTGILVGVVVCVLITLFGSGTLAWLLAGEHIQEGALRYGTVVTLLISVVAGSLAAVRITEEKRLLVSILVGAGYLLALLGCTALLFGGQYQGVTVTALVILAGCLSVALLGLKVRKTHINTRHKYRTR